MIAGSSPTAETSTSSSHPLPSRDARVQAQAQARPPSEMQNSASEPSELPVTYSTDPLVRRSGEREDTNKTALPHVNGADHKERELPRLQVNEQLEQGDRFEPILEDDPASFNLLNPPLVEHSDVFSLENQTQALFSRGHLQVIFGDPGFLFKFTSFLGTHRPQSVPILVHYLDSLKSLRAIHYANAICEGLDPIEGLEFTQWPVKPTINTGLEDRAYKAFEVLTTEELPAYVTHQYIQIVSASITARITGSLSPHLRDASDGLAEVFCLTDPSRQDNPIVFASEGRPYPGLRRVRYACH